MDEMNTDVNVMSDDTAQSLSERYAAAKKKKVKRSIIVLVIVALVIAVAFGAYKYFGNSGYKATVDKYMDAFTSENNNAVTELYSSYYSAKKLSGISIEDTVLNSQQIITNAHDNFKDNLGEDYKISYEITSVDVMREAEFDAMVNALAFGGYNAKQIITDAMRVELTITAEADDEMTHIITLLLTEEDGEWLILGFE